MSRKTKMVGTRTRPGPRPTTRSSTPRKAASPKTGANKPVARKAPARKTPQRKAPAKKPSTTTRSRAKTRATPDAHNTPRRRTAHVDTAPRSRAKAASSVGSIPSRRTTSSDHNTASTAKWWAIGAMVFLTALFVSVLEAPFFEATTVQISGVARTSDGAIYDALAIAPDQALLTYGTAGAAESIGELPWVKSVEVTRQWPSTVRVVVREHAVSATIGSPNGARWLVVGEDGSVLEERLTPPSGVPLLVATRAILDSAAIGEPVTGVERALEIAHDVPLQLDPWITMWTVDDEGHVVARLVGSADANFGAFEDHRTQFVSLASILDGGAPLVCLSNIDLSVADTPVLHRDANCLLASQEL